MVAFANAMAGGILAPIRPTGTSIRPHWTVPMGGLATTATRIYYNYIYLDQVETWTGFRVYNSGAGDNGLVYRLGIYTMASTGLPGTLIGSSAEQTLTGASAVRTVAASSTFTNTYVGWHFTAFQASSTPSFYSCQAGDTTSGFVNPIAASLGTMDTSGADFGIGGAKLYSFLYINSAYGALASTAVAPTNSTNQSPEIRLYK